MTKQKKLNMFKRIQYPVRLTPLKAPTFRGKKLLSVSLPNFAVFFDKNVNRRQVTG